MRGPNRLMPPPPAYGCKGSTNAGTTKGSASPTKGSGKNLPPPPGKGAGPVRGGVPSGKGPGGPQPQGNRTPLPPPPRPFAWGQTPPQHAGPSRPPLAAPPQIGPVGPSGQPVSGSGPTRPDIEGTKLRVYCATEHDDTGIQTLVGEYSQGGINHGKKFYQKTAAVPGHEGTQVFLYYWDDRDGPDFAGWWFGDQVGGSQVWSRAISHGQGPPREGWKIPWDGPVRADLSVEPIEPAMAPPTPAPAPTPTPPPVPAPSIAPLFEWDEDPPPPPQPVQEPSPTVRTAIEQVETVEAESQVMLRNYEDILSRPQTTPDQLLEAEHMIKLQKEGVQETQRWLAEQIRTSAEPPAPLANLMPRLRVVEKSLVDELSQVQRELQSGGRWQDATPSQVRRGPAPDEAEQQDRRDQQALQDALPDAIEIVTQAEDAVETVAIMASSFGADDDLGEAAARTMAELESSAARATQNILAARKLIAAKLQEAKKYTLNTRKMAMREYESLQSKVTEASRKLDPLKKFRAKYENKLAVRKELDDIADGISNAEVAVEKAQITASQPDSQLSEDEIKSIDELLVPANGDIMRYLQQMDKKSRQAEELGLERERQVVVERARLALERLDGVRALVKKQKESHQAQAMLNQAHTAVDKAEEAVLATQEAEMPFLQGVEELPPKEAEQAVAASEAAGARAELAVGHAKSLIKGKLTDPNTRYSRDLARRIASELGELSKRIDTASRKLLAFRKDTLERKTKAMLSDIVVLITDAKANVEAFSEVVKPFSTERLDEISNDALQAIIDKCREADKSATGACQFAKKTLGEKQHKSKEPTLVAELSKLQARLNDITTELTKCRKQASIGERLAKGQEVLAERTESLARAEVLVGEAKTLAAPLIAEEAGDEQVKEAGAGVTAAQSAVAGVVRAVERDASGAVAPLRAALGKLLEKARNLQKQLDEVERSTRAQRERVCGQAYIEEAKRKTDEAEKNLEKIEEAEAPFSKGVEVLPAEEQDALMKECEKVVEVVHRSITEARAFIASKILEGRKFVEHVSKKMGSELAPLTDRLNAAAQKLSKFKKETDARRTSALVQEAASRVNEVEAEVESTAKAAAPLVDEDIERMSAESTAEICGKLAKMIKTAQTNLERTKSFLLDRQREARGSAAQDDELKKLLSRLSAAQGELGKAKKAASEREQKFVAFRLLSEANKLFKDAEEAVQNAEAKAVPLVFNGGLSFLVAGNVRKVVGAWREKMKSSNLTPEQLWKDIGGGAKSEFMQHLEDLPKQAGSEELAFTDQQREAMFASINSSKDGTVSEEEFKSLFRERFVCVNTTSITDVLDISKCKTLAKAELDDILESVGDMSTNAQGVTRLECKVISTTNPDSQALGKTGWVTMQGNKSTKYLEPFSPYEAFTRALDRQMDGAGKSALKAGAFVKQKAGELASCASGPLAEARSELLALRSRATAAQKSMEDLKKKVLEARRDFSKKEERERRAVEEARDRKAATSLLEEVGEKKAALMKAVLKLEDAVKPLIDATGSELEAIATPITLSTEASKMAAAITEAAAATRSCINEHKPTVAAATWGPLLEARESITKAASAADAAEVRCKAALGDLKDACDKLVEARLVNTTSALRSDATTRNVSLDELFVEIAGAGKERITDEALMAHLESLLKPTLTSEQAKLVCNRLEEGGVSRRSFLRALQQYYSVMKQVSLTDGLEISTSKSVRMLEPEEVLELLEGPCGDEKLGMTRIRVKALRDGALGWVSLKGNQGTPFLQRVAKPHYCCMADMHIEQAVDCGSIVVRRLEAQEILEVLEGPRKEGKPGETQRARVKACKDGTTGWISLTDRSGEVCAEPAAKHYICIAPTAVTDVSDINECKVQRKLEVNEVLHMLEAPQKVGEMMRFKCISKMDGLTGWVTIKGSGGKVFLEESRKFYSVLKDLCMDKQFSSDSPSLPRRLAKGESVEILEGPKEEKLLAPIRVKVRALNDGAAGWITMKDRVLKPWASHYECVNATPMHNQLSMKGAQVIRRVDVGEVIELLEGPAEENDFGLARIRGRAAKDGAEGWVSITFQSAVFLSPQAA